MRNQVSVIILQHSCFFSSFFLTNNLNISLWHLLKSFSYVQGKKIPFVVLAWSIWKWELYFFYITMQKIRRSKLFCPVMSWMYSRLLLSHISWDCPDLFDSSGVWVKWTSNFFQLWTWVVSTGIALFQNKDFALKCNAYYLFLL